ncbi:MFS transporter [Lactiplantibacillus plantarum]|uniref:MFS transporter n=1 Tax=Lactiplantibacillus plantarum TaxID=1590 RepID=UPI0005F03EB4|nr:MFS transporter [Lactiplantibacillus plantarum]KZV02947.1 transport protein [Lactiplantibacillus plantarum]OEZ36620.1 MFS transporter [Lactiplantibacillus plantarum]WBB05484.1 MFS transporter [Lactiplantibacillus plantarum]
MKRVLVYNAFSNVMFEIVVWMIYLKNQGWTTGEIAILEGIFTISQFIFELPSGVISDKLGHKLTLVLGEISCFIYLFGFFFPHIHLIMYISFILFALGLSLISGTDVSVLYDSIPLKDKNKYIKYSGIFNSIGILGVAFGNAGGGWLAKISWTTLFIIAIIFRFCAIIAAMSINEDNFEDADELQINQSILKKMYSFLKDNKGYQKLLLVICFSDAAVTITYQYGSLLLSTIHIPTELVSTIFGIISLLGALVSYLVYEVVKRIDENKVALGLVELSMILALLFITKNKIVIVFGLIIINVSFEMWNVILENKIQKIVLEDIRATSISTINLFTSLLLTISSFLISAMSKETSMELTVGILSGSGLFVSGLVFIFYIKKMEEKYYDIK